MDVSSLCHKVAYKPWTVVEGQGRFAICVNDAPNLRRYVASLEVVRPPSKTSNCGMYHL